jgi:predicted transcriptional regulator
MGDEMATSVRLDDDFVEEAQVYAEAAKRSVPKQIEHWAEIGRIVEDNPDLSYQFIRDALLATAEINAGRTSKYVRRKFTARDNPDKNI